MLVQAHAVETEPVHFGPGLEVLFERTRANFRIETVTGERIGQEPGGLGVLEMRPIGNEIEQKNFHSAGCS
jgi:hypothetical protein